MGSQRQVAQIGLGVARDHGAEGRQPEIDEPAVIVTAKLARAMDVFGVDQRAAHPMGGIERGELKRLELVPGPGSVARRAVGAIGGRRLCPRALRRAHDQRAHDQAQSQPAPHARTSETGPRLSTNCSALTSIFCSIVSITLLSRALLVLRAAAQAQPFVVVELVALAAGSVVVDVLAMLQAQAAAAGQQDRQVAVRVAVAVAHAAAEQDHRAVEQRLLPSSEMPVSWSRK